MGCCASRDRVRAATFEFDERSKPAVVETVAETVERASNEIDLKRVNGYRIGRALGTGTYGTVHEGTGADGLKVAIKVISGSVTRRGTLRRPDARVKLADVDKREIAVMKNLTHPHCVQLFEVIDDPENSRTFLIMELLRGGTVLDPDNLPPDMDHLPEACARVVFRELLQGLDYLHRNGVMHRDIKPDNIGHAHRPAWGRAAMRSRKRFASATRDIHLTQSLHESMAMAPGDLAQVTAEQTLVAQRDTIDSEAEFQRWSRASSRLELSPVSARRSSSRPDLTRNRSRSEVAGAASGGAGRRRLPPLASSSRSESRTDVVPSGASGSAGRWRPPPAAGPSRKASRAEVEFHGGAGSPGTGRRRPSVGLASPRVRFGGAVAGAAELAETEPRVDGEASGDLEEWRIEAESRAEAEKISYTYRPALMANVKLLDFGISHLGRAPLAGAAAAGGDVWLDTATGTPAFYAPEMCDKGGYLGMPADIWAAGVTLCMMTGSEPFAAPHTPAMFARIRSGEPDLPADASPGLWRMLRRMLEKDARQRATMAELLTDPWVTDGGRFPMPTNFALVTVNEADIRSAVSTRFGSTITVLMAKDRLRQLVRDRRAARGGEPAAGGDAAGMPFSGPSPRAGPRTGRGSCGDDGGEDGGGGARHRH